MVKLIQREIGYLNNLEKRLAHCGRRIQEGRNSSFMESEEHALLWMLEVLEHAARTDCDEAFIYTLARHHPSALDGIPRRPESGPPPPVSEQAAKSKRANDQFETRLRAQRAQRASVNRRLNERVKRQLEASRDLADAKWAAALPDPTVASNLPGNP